MNDNPLKTISLKEWVSGKKLEDLEKTKINNIISVEDFSGNDILSTNEAREIVDLPPIRQDDFDFELKYNELNYIQECHNANISRLKNFMGVENDK